MKSNPSPVESQGRIHAALCANDAPRALIVSLDDAGQLQHEAVGHGQSVLNLETELQDHLSARPYSTAFLESLRDYCAGRLAARQEAKASGGVSMPSARGWDIVHVVAQAVQ